MLFRGKDKWNDFFELGMYILGVICFVYFLNEKIYIKVFEAALIIATLIFIRLLFKFIKLELFPLLRFSILFFIFIAMFMANEFGYYGKIPHLDKIEHLFSGVILSFLGVSVFRKIIKQEMDFPLHSSIEVWFSLYFSIAMAGCWEIFEFSTDSFFGFSSQNGSINDTMLDMICGMVGAILTSLFLRFKKAKKVPAGKGTDFMA